MQSVFFGGAVWAHRDTVARFDAKFLRQAHADIRAVLRQGNILICLVRKTNQIMADFINVKADRLFRKLHAYGLACISVISFFERLYCPVISRFGKIDATLIIGRTVIIKRQKRMHRVIHAERTYDEHRAACNSDQAHCRARLVPRNIAQIPTRSE